MSIKAIFECSDIVCIFYILGQVIPSSYSRKEKRLVRSTSANRLYIVCVS